MGNLDTESGCAGYHSHVAMNFIIIIFKENMEMVS